MSIQTPPEHTDLDIGDNHWIKWITDGNTCFGAIIWHRLPQGAADNLMHGWCASSVIFDIPATERMPQPKWQLTGEPGPAMTLTPSILCGCGDHGFIRNGKWVKA